MYPGNGRTDPAGSRRPRRYIRRPLAGRYARMRGIFVYWY